MSVMYSNNKLRLYYFIEPDEKLSVVDRFSFYSEEISEKVDQLSEARQECATEIKILSKNKSKPP